MQEIVYKSQKGSAVTDSERVAWKFQKRHADVLRAIETLLEDIKSQVTEHERKNAPMFHLTHREVTLGNGARRPSPIYMMTEEGFTLLAMGFTGKKAVRFKLDYIDAFQKMKRIIHDIETEKELSDYPKTYSDALRRLADQWDLNKKLEETNKEAGMQVERLSQLVNEQTPKVAYYDRLVDGDGLTCLRDTAKMLEVEERIFLSELVDRQILYRDLSKKLKPYARYIKEGLFALKEWQIEINAKEKGDTKIKAGNQTKVTQKGREFLTKIFHKSQLTKAA